MNVHIKNKNKKKIWIPNMAGQATIVFHFLI